jgi:hypothetical protein
MEEKRPKNPYEKGKNTSTSTDNQKSGSGSSLRKLRRAMLSGSHEWRAVLWWVMKSGGH